MVHANINDVRDYHHAGHNAHRCAFTPSPPPTRCFMLHVAMAAVSPPRCRRNANALLLVACLATAVASKPGATALAHPWQAQPAQTPLSLTKIAALRVVRPTWESSGAACSLPAAANYRCYPGFCASNVPVHLPRPTCGPELAELRLGGSSLAERVQLAALWCDANRTRASAATIRTPTPASAAADGGPWSSTAQDEQPPRCVGFSIDPTNPTTLTYSQANFTAAAQPNGDWVSFWVGDWPAPPAPPTPPAPPPPSPWQPILPQGHCGTDEGCSLNGVCEASGKCVCFAGWRGHNCQYLALAPLPPIAGYGQSPNVTSWGGSIYHNSSDTNGQYHLYVTEEVNGKGLASWVTNSIIVHAVASTPLGPYEKRDVVSSVSTSNPQILFDSTFNTFLLFHINGAGETVMRAFTIPVQ